ncbi:MAG: GNAT family N-acetyltransferase, partial [Candidatus Melainabacteria bacterium HGW-Melainabacteria-1]
MSLPLPISEPLWRIVPAQPDDAAGIARVHVLSWQAAYQGLLPSELLERLDVETRRRQWREWLTGPAAPQALVALDASGEVLGFVSGGPLRG